MRLRPHILLSAVILCCSCDDTFVPDDGLDYAEISQKFVKQLYERTQTIRSSSASGQADFIYITDTHLADNNLQSPSLLKFLLHNGFSRQVFWGGDAISAYGDIEREWNDHQRLFLDAAKGLGKYYMIRGNHEFTQMNQSLSRGITYDAKRTAQMLRSDSEIDIVRPDDDPEACYYYIDDPSRKLRYCIYDTTDSISSEDKAWATVVHTSKHQLAWMDANALHNVPSGYSLIVFTHVGITASTYYVHDPLEPLRQSILHAEAPVLMVISGHMHQDFQTYDHGILHVLTGSDAAYPEYNHSPFLHNIKRRVSGVTSQLFDSFVISPDRQTIDAIRFGAGFNRTFHLDTIQLSISDKSCQLHVSRLQDVDNWKSYDAQGYACSESMWQPPNSIITITPTGHVIPRRPGSAVAMATDASGHKEFFPITIVQ